MFEKNCDKIFIFSVKVLVVLRQSTIGRKKTSGKFLKPKVKNYIFTIFYNIKGSLHRLASGAEEKRRIKVSTMSDISTQFSRLDRYLFTDTLKKLLKII
jgi:hypothetical protein